ncbi:MAG: permease-like cell division protein FtsX, partial [Bacteroidota bacterium]|nr:permease-like cell division protein FtsX [Bacteroidota bacterium]
MEKQAEKITLGRLRTAYATTVVSITLVLFMLGLLGSILFYASKISTHVKENIGFMIIMKPDVNEARIIQLQKQLQVSNFVRSSEYITKEQAAAQMKEYLGEDFISFLGINPLLPSIEVKLVASYANNDSLKVLSNRMMANPSVKEVLYQKSLVEELNNNITLISGVLLGFSILLLIIAFALISNTIRLAVYSRRFLIRSMLLVGATGRFIRKPFITKGIAQGAIASLFALIMLTGLLITA